MDKNRPRETQGREFEHDCNIHSVLEFPRDLPEVFTGSVSFPHGAQHRVEALEW